MNRTSVILLSALLLRVCAGAAEPAAGSGDDVLSRMREFFDVSGGRGTGTPGNLEIERRVQQRFAASGFKHGAIAFEAPKFVPGPAALTLPDGQRVPLLPMHPSLFRPGNFLEKEFEARLVFLGRGTNQDLKQLEGTSLHGTLAVMDFNCGEAWQNFLRFGIRGFLFIGQDAYTHREAVGKVYATEVRVPRYFIEPAPGARLRALLQGAETSPKVRVTAEPSRWESVRVHDHWVMIPGRDPDLGKDVCVFVAPMDANCIVPELAVGAQAGANLFLLLRLLEEFQKTPPARSVLLAAVNAHTHCFLGERMLAWHLLAPDQSVDGVRNLLATTARREEMYAREYGNIQLRPETLEEDNEYVNELRTRIDETTGRRVIVKEPLQELAKRRTNEVKTEILEVAQAEMTEEEREKRLEELRVLKKQYTRVLVLFNKIDVGKNRLELKKLNDAEKAILRGYVTGLVDRNRRWAALNRQHIELDTANGAIRDALGTNRVSFVVTLDLTWTSVRVGFSSFNPLARGKWAREFGLGTVAIAKTLAEARGREESEFLADTMTGYAGLVEEYYFPEPASSISYFHAAGKTPAFSLRTVLTEMGRAFLPTDTFDALDPTCVGKLMHYLPTFFRAMLGDPEITVSSKLPPPRLKAGSWAILIKAFKMDEFSAKTIPQLQVPDSVAIVYPRMADLRPSASGMCHLPIVAGDVINLYFALTGFRASAVLYGLKEDATGDAPLVSAAFHLDDDFTVVDHALDMGRIQEMQLKSTIFQSSSKVIPMFRCREFPVYVRHDASLVSARAIRVDTLWPITGERNSAPLKYGVTGVGCLSNARPGSVTPVTAGPAAVYLEQKKIQRRSDALKLLTGQKRLGLNATPEAPEGKGFVDPEQMGPDFFAVAAKDMSILNRYRLSKMSGVSNELIQDFLQQGDEAVEQMEVARAQKQHTKYLRSVHAAAGAQAKAYGQLGAITNDMLKAIVFYMALLLPFCFFLQKLLFNFVRIELQMLALIGLFVLTYLVFRSIHPAFRIAVTPEAIFIAFVLGAIGAFVILIMHRRFQGEMELIFRAYIGARGEAAYSTVGQQALLIGVNNMRRRRIRTTLTTATIVLVTFTMLSFSSVSKKMSPTIIRRAKDAPYTGIFFQWPGNKPMDEATAQVFQDLFSDRARLVIRRWLMAGTNNQGLTTAFHLTSSTREAIPVKAILGLSTAEQGFLAPMPLLTGGRFFSSDDAPEAILPAGAAEALDISSKQVGNVKLDLLGREFTLVGIMDDLRFNYIRDLNGRALLPIERVAQAGAEVFSEEEEDESSIFYVDPAALLILPVNVAKDLGAQPASVSMQFRKDTDLWSILEEILTATSAKFFIGSKEPFLSGEERKRTTMPGTYYVGSGYKTSIGGVTRLIIPLIIAGTIILNTMLGAVYERKKEIAVYNAVGLNPTHIAFFFLGEAFVYSVLGSVGGYLIGQVMAIGLQKLQLVSEVNVNFSSLIVAYVIAFTVALVLLSTLYPAWVATRTAVPSGKRKWSMPEHDGHQMHVVFPFIYQPNLALAVMAYLEEFFARYTEASVGELIAVLEERGRQQDDQGRDIYVLRYHVALAPFDLGVTQTVAFRATYHGNVESFRIEMTTTRVSGQDTNWVTTNKPFLERMRRYLLQWRNLDATRHAFYEQQARKAFAGMTNDETPNDE